MYIYIYISLQTYSILHVGSNPVSSKVHCVPSPTDQWCGIFPATTISQVDGLPHVSRQQSSDVFSEKAYFTGLTGAKCGRSSCLDCGAVQICHLLLFDMLFRPGMMISPFTFTCFLLGPTKSLFSSSHLGFSWPSRLL